MFKLLVVLPAIFMGLQGVAWWFGLASMGEMILTTQLTIIIYEIRRCFWSEKDYIESQKILFNPWRRK